MLEQMKFLKWYAEEKAHKGLVDIKFFAGEGCVAKNATSEDFFREANHVNDLYQQKKFVVRSNEFAW